MKKIQIAAAHARKGAGYPAPFGEPCRERVRRILEEAAAQISQGVDRD